MYILILCKRKVWFGIIAIKNLFTYSNWIFTGLSRENFFASRRWFLGKISLARNCVGIGSYCLRQICSFPKLLCIDCKKSISCSWIYVPVHQFILFYKNKFVLIKNKYKKFHLRTFMSIRKNANTDNYIVLHRTWYLF